MSNLTKNTEGVWSGSETLQKKTSTLSLPTGGKYVDTDISLSLSVKDGSATTPTTTISTPTKASGSVSTGGLVTITTNKASGTITPTVSAGWVSSGTAGTVSVNGTSYTHQLSTKSAQTYTPTTSNQTINAGVYLTGSQTIVGSSNLVSANFPQGFSIFNVSGVQPGHNLYNHKFRRANGTINGANSIITENNGTFTMVSSGTDPYMWNCAGSVGNTYGDSFGPLITIPSSSNSLTVKISDSRITKNYITFWDSAKKSLNTSYTNIANGGTIAASAMPAGTKYVSFRFGHGESTTGTTYNFTVMVNYGNVALTWSPYFDSTISYAQYSASNWVIPSVSSTTVVVPNNTYTQGDIHVAPMSYGTQATFTNVTSGTSSDLQIVSSAGYAPVKYINKLTVPSNKTLATVENNGTISRLYGTGTATIKTNDSAKISMQTGATLYLTDSITGNTWIIKTDSTNNALSIEQQ